MKDKGKIFVSYRGKTIIIEEERIKAREILKRFGLSEEYAFVVRDGNIVDGDEIIKDGEKVRVINAISGG